MSAAPIKFFKKNLIDLSNTPGTITVTDTLATDDGSDVIDFVRNRENDSAWVTTGSADANNTQLDIDLGEGRDMDSILLVKHNWKAFTIKYWNGSAYTDFSTAIAQTTNTDETSFFSFTQVECQLIRIIITGTQTANDDKHLYQLILAELIGTLAGWPMIKNPMHDRNKKITKMLSGKANVQESVGAFAVDLEVSNWRSQADLDVVDEVYFKRDAVLVWLCGGNESQFSMELRGYRLEDIYMMRPTNSFEPEYVKGLYQTGTKIKIALTEAIA